MMTIRFSVDQIDAMMLDIEGLKLPTSANYAVLKLVLGLIEGYAAREDADEAITMEYGRAADMPDFLKSQAKRDRPDEGVIVTSIRAALAETEDRQPKTAVAPQAAFSPAPLPEALREDPQPAPAAPIEATELKTGAWSQEEEDHVKTQRAKGVLFKDIAQQLNRPISAVKAKGNALMKDPKPASPRQWTAEQEGILISGHKTGTPLAVTAKEIGKSEGACGAKLKYIRRHYPEKIEAATEPTSPALEKRVEEAHPKPALTSKAEGGKGILPRPCPDESWPIEDDFDLVSEHHRGLSMLDVSVILERTRKECVARYKTLIEAMPEGAFTERQVKLKQTLAHHASLARAAA